MRKLISNTKGITLIEVMIAVAILLIIARFVFASQLREWEDNLWLSLGVPPVIPRVGLAICIFFYFVWRLTSEGKARNKRILK